MGNVIFHLQLNALIHCKTFQRRIVIKPKPYKIYKVQSPNINNK